MKNNIGKKGAILHWTIFGILAALAIIVAFTDIDLMGIQKKGEWQTDFLVHNYFAAEKTLLKIDAAAKNIGTEIAFILAENGGFTGESPCGGNFWNDQEKWCFPLVKEALISLAQDKLKSRIPDQKYSSVTSEGTLFIANATINKIVTDTAMYYYNPSFAVDLGYSFDEYNQLQNEAFKLVNTCRNQADLKSCLDSARNSYWKYTSCENEDYSSTSDTRKIAFCVVSPNRYYLPLGEQLIRDKQLINYKLSLDFTPTKPFIINTLQLDYHPDTNIYTLTFPSASSVESYTIYYTNWPSASSSSSHLPEEIFQTMPTADAFGYYFKKVSFIPLSSCPVDQEVGKAHLCDGKVVYSLADYRFTSQTLFTITSVLNQQESEISSFFSVS